MEKAVINPEGIFNHPGFSRMVAIRNPGTLIFIAGQTPSDANYEPVALGDYLGQYLQVMENLALQLAAAGATWDDVVFRRIFVLDVDKFAEAILAPGVPSFFDPARMPPSTMIGVTRLSKPEFLVEIDLMAVTAA